MRFIPVLMILALALAACATTSTTVVVQDSIDSFDECVAAGNAVMESYPRQCQADGKTFTETVPEDDTDVVVDVDVTGGVVDQNIVEVKVTAFEFGFEPSTITVPKGSRVRLVATSREGNHGIGIPAFGVNTGEFDAGETRTVEFTADKAGEYPFFCNVFCGSGHRDMKGTLVVTEN